MADIQINKRSETGTAVYYDLTIGRRDISIGYSRTGEYLNIMCKNAAHKAYNGTGRHFWGRNIMTQAKQAYKSSEVRSAINFITSCLVNDLARLYEGTRDQDGWETLELTVYHNHGREIGDLILEKLQ